MKKFTKTFSVALASVLVLLTATACAGKDKKGNDNTDKSSDPKTSDEQPSDSSKDTSDSSEEMGGTAEGKINVYTRDSASGTRGAFEELIDFKGELTGDAAEVASNGDMATKVGEDANGVGYVSLTTDFDANNLKPVKFEGVDASEEHVIDGSYTLKRPFSYVSRATGTYESEEVEQLVDAFVVFLTQSTEGLEAVASAGGIVDVESGKAWEELKTQFPIVDQDNSARTIRTGGSTSVTKALDAAIDAFQPLAGNVQFAPDHTGSGDGFTRTLGDDKDGANAADLGFASREFKDSETVSDGKHNGAFAQDAVVVVVSKENPTEDLTKAQVKDIFTGVAKSWEDVK